MVGEIQRAAAVFTSLGFPFYSSHCLGELGFTSLPAIAQEWAWVSRTPSLLCMYMKLSWTWVGVGRGPPLP